MRRGILIFLTFLGMLAACGDDDPAPGGGGNVTPGEDGGPPTPGEDGQAAGDGAPPPPPSKVNVTDEKIDVDGVLRTYVLAVPKTYDAAKKYPLVLVFHGDGGDGPGMRGYHKFDSASGDDAIVAYPTGRNATWETNGPSADNPDHVFMQKLIPALKAKYSVSKVFGVGWSKGGFFITHALCRQPDMFEAAVLHAAGVPYDETTLNGTWPSSGGLQKCDGQTSRAAASMPVMITHGTLDSNAGGGVDFEGGDYLRSWYAYFNECADTRTKIAPAPCESHDSCKSGKPVVWCPIEGNGHGIWDQGVTAGWGFLKSLL
jgi:polyhydroxybutyrate depolymerase